MQKNIKGVINRMKRQCLPHYWSEKKFKGYRIVVNRTLPSLHLGSPWNYTFQSLLIVKVVCDKRKGVLGKTRIEFVTNIFSLKISHYFKIRWIKKWHQLVMQFLYSHTPLYIYSQPRLFKEFDILQEIKVSLSQLFKSSSFCDANLYWSQYPKLWICTKRKFYNLYIV